MSYYGSYASYTSYSSYTSPSSYNDNYNYNSGYDSYSCTSAASYLLDAAHFKDEVRYGSFGSQCSNWQNTASTIMLWHLFALNDSCIASWACGKSVDIHLEVDENEDSLEGFTDGVLAFMEQISGHINLDTQQINITICDTIKSVDTNFIHGLLAFLIESFDIEKVARTVKIQSINSSAEDTYARFIINYDEISKQNITQTAIIKNSIEEAKALEIANQEELLSLKKSGKKGLTTSVAGIALSAVLFLLNVVGLLSIGIILSRALMIFFIVYLFVSLYQLSASSKSFGSKTFNSLASKKTILEQLNDV